MNEASGEISFTTRGGIQRPPLRRARRRRRAAIAACREALDTRLGAVFSSNYEYPGRYTRWDVGFLDPPLSLTARGREIEIAALNERGVALLPGIAEASPAPIGSRVYPEAGALRSPSGSPKARFTEEERIRQPTAFSAVRALVALFGNGECPHLGLYGAFGYDLAFQFDPIRKRLARPADQRDLVLYLPDEIIVVDHYAGKATRFSYDFELAGRSTFGLGRGGKSEALSLRRMLDPPACDHAAGRICRRSCAKRSRVSSAAIFSRSCRARPSSRAAPPRLLRFRRARAHQPRALRLHDQSRDGEYLVGASPEMFVRVTGGRRIETCPISGTISRGADAISDAEQVRKLLTRRRTRPSSPCARMSTATTNRASASRARCA